MNPFAQKIAAPRRHARWFRQTFWPIERRNGPRECARRLRQRGHQLWMADDTGKLTVKAGVTPCPF